MGRRDPLEVLAVARHQVEFIESSCLQFDSGRTHFALQLATNVRTLVLDGPSSPSILTQLGVKTSAPWFAGPNWQSPIDGLEGGTVLSEHSNVDLELSGAGLAHHAQLSEPDAQSRWVSFGAWWTESVLTLDEGRSWTRERVVRDLANKSGGAHFDPVAPAALRQLELQGLGWVVETPDGERPFLESPLPYVMRTMAHQLLVTLDTQAPHISLWGEGHYRTP